MKTFHVKSIILKAFLCILYVNLSYAQENTVEDTNDRQWFVGLDYGLMMSGIKDEDFVSSNYSPVIRVFVGKWFNKSIGVKTGYQGTYFKTIADDIRHPYNFFYGELMFDVKNVFFDQKEKRFYRPVAHLGPGYFYNFVYRRGNIHGVLGMSNYFSFLKNLEVNFDVSAIIGWDIYQGDSDILPSISLGVSYNF